MNIAKIQLTWPYTIRVSFGMTSTILMLLSSFWISNIYIVLINKETTKTPKDRTIQILTKKRDWDHLFRKSYISGSIFDDIFLYIEDTKTRLDINTMLHLHSNLLHSSFANCLKRQYQTNISDESNFIFFWAEFVLDIKISIIIHFTYNRTKMGNFDSKQWPPFWSLHLQINCVVPPWNMPLWFRRTEYPYSCWWPRKCLINYFNKGCWNFRTSSIFDRSSPMFRKSLLNVAWTAIGYSRIQDRPNI